MGIPAQVAAGVDDLSACGVPVARSESCTAASSIAKRLSRSGFAGATAFHGVPFTVEDSLDVRGRGSARGSALFRNGAPAAPGLRADPKRAGPRAPPGRRCPGSPDRGVLGSRTDPSCSRGNSANYCETPSCRATCSAAR
ncbi:hypothetical protein DMP23_43750 [Amycolatopsis sp. A1MSW2902]